MTDVDKVVLSGPSNLLIPAATQIIAENQLLRELRSFQEAPEKNLSVSVKGKPRVSLKFYKRDPETGQRYESDVSFRLMSKTVTSLTMQDVKLLAQRINSKFVEPLFVQKKGKRKIQYTDRENGFVNVWSLFESKAEGERFFEQVLDLVGLPLDRQKLTDISEFDLEGKYSGGTRTYRILDEVFKEYEKRPIVGVPFSGAMLTAGPKKLTLVDTTGKLTPPPFDLD